jgi:hypothetical protein
MTLHPRLDEHSNPVLIHHPHAPTSLDTWVKDLIPVDCLLDPLLLGTCFGLVDNFGDSVFGLCHRIEF